MKIIIEEGIENIGAYAFYNCKSLSNSVYSPLHIYDNITSFSYCFTGVEKDIYIDAHNDTNSNLVGASLIAQDSNVILRIYQNNVHFDASTGITQGYNFRSNISALINSTTAKYSFSPTVSGKYQITNYDIDAIKHGNFYDSTDSSYEYTSPCSCGAISPSLPPSPQLENIQVSDGYTYDSYGYVVCNGSLVAYNDDSGGSVYGSGMYDINYYEEYYCDICDSYAYAERYSDYSIAYKYYTFAMTPALTQNTTYDIYSTTYGSPSGTYQNYILINYCHNQ